MKNLISEVYNIDCNLKMLEYPDNFFDKETQAVGSIYTIDV